MTAQARAEEARILDIQSATSPNGIAFWLVEDHSLPILTIDFAFAGAGSVNDPADKTGVAQLLSNTMDEGAGARDALTFQESLQDHAVELSFSSGRDHFMGQLKTLTKHQPIALELLHDAVTSPRFEDEAVNRMKQANIMRIKSSLINNDWLSARLMNDVYFGDHPYARNSGGTLSGIAAITSVDLNTFKDRYLTQNRLRISIAGDVTAEMAGQIIDQVFGDIPSGGVVDTIDAVTAPKTPVQKAYKTDNPQSSVQMIWTAFPRTDKDFYALKVMNHMLGGGGFSSALMEQVREKRGLTYGIYSRVSNMDYANYLAIESATSPDNIAPMEAAVADVITQFKTTPVDDTLLSDAKNYLIGSLPLKFSSTQSLSKTTLAMQMDGLPMDYLDQWDENISKVTAEDIQRVANRIFGDTTPDALTIAGGLPDDLQIERVEIVPGVE